MNIMSRVEFDYCLMHESVAALVDVYILHDRCGSYYWALSAIMRTFDQGTC